ncbi:MAG: DUF922 domain-containing protein [Nitrospirae bacterium]|nr:DUF922 domain-containing protein [Nitrospirota bacterium]
MVLVRFILFLAVFLYVCPVYADVIYQYFDKDGTLVITNRPFPIKKAPHPDIRHKDTRFIYREDISYDYYTVTGRNFQEVVSSTNISGPIDPADNRNYAAQTRWNMGWAYKFHSSYRIDGSYVNVSLDIFDVEFRFDITVLLPRLTGNTILNHYESDLWENFLQGLLEHEHDHVRIIKDPLYRDDALKKFSSVKELTLNYEQDSDINEAIKKAVESETAKIGHDLIKMIKLKNDEYDRLTEHGMKPEMREVFFRRL